MQHFVNFEVSICLAFDVTLFALENIFCCCVDGVCHFAMIVQRLLKKQ
jgi:hypothetical protein